VRHDSPSHCSICIAKSQATQRKGYTIPRQTVNPVNCPIHGDPRDLSGDWPFFIELYFMLHPYSVFRHRRVVDKHGKEREEEVGFLNLSVLKIVCEALHLSFRTTWVRLSEIEDIWYGRHLKKPS